MAAAVVLVVLAGPALAAVAGVKDWTYPSGAARGGAVTGEKPESKLWTVGSSWWALMAPPSGSAYRFYKLNADARTWTDKGPGGDDRQAAKPDVLFRNNVLYVLSRDTLGGKNRLYRYAYANDAFTPIGGYVPVPGGRAETLTLAQEPGGQLWIAYVAASKVTVAHSAGADYAKWTSVAVPKAGPVGVDDVATVVAFGNRVGVAWSNQRDGRDYFAWHANGTPDHLWTIETAYSAGVAADDHLNVKATSDGTVWIATKTGNKGAAQPLVVLLRRTPQGAWSSRTVFTGETKATRPIVVVKEGAAGRAFVLATASQSVLMKSADLGSGPFGGATTVMGGDGSGEINDVTSTKGSVTSATGLVAVASQASRRSYWHARLAV